MSQDWSGTSVWNFSIYKTSLKKAFLGTLFQTNTETCMHSGYKIVASFPSNATAYHVWSFEHWKCDINLFLKKIVPNTGLPAYSDTSYNVAVKSSPLTVTLF